MAMFEGLLASRSVLLFTSALSLLFFIGVLLLSFTSAIFVPLSLNWFSTVSSSLFCRYYMQKKMKAETEWQSLLVSGFSSLFFFSFFFLFYCLPSRSQSNARMKEKELPRSLFFSPLLLPASLTLFLVFIFSSFPPPSPLG